MGGAKQRSLAEAIAVERDPNVPDAQLSAQGRIRRAFFNGEEFTIKGSGERFGCSDSLTGQVIKHLERNGYHFAKRHVEGTKYLHTWRMTNPEWSPPTWVPQNQMMKENAERAARNRRLQEHGKSTDVEVVDKTKRTKSDKPKSKPTPVHDNLLPVLPTLGSTVTVTMVALDPDGGVVMAMRNGDYAWMVTLTGSTQIG